MDRVLDLGCRVGGSSFELAVAYAEVCHSFVGKQKRSRVCGVWTRSVVACAEVRRSRMTVMICTEVYHTR